MGITRIRFSTTICNASLRVCPSDSQKPILKATLTPVGFPKENFLRSAPGVGWLDGMAWE
ncbi:hypothetical protein LI328DRAFT_135310 [Trichoderma asperelloides]|nr:hypothetical protein LI328DRAFT_135310 [Trichoderma asperelloides]